MADGKEEFHEDHLDLESFPSDAKYRLVLQTLHVCQHTQNRAGTFKKHTITIDLTFMVWYR